MRFVSRYAPATATRTRFSLAIGLSLLVAAAGCGSGDVADNPDTTRIGALGRLYAEYRIKSRGQLPPNEEQLRKFATGDGARILSQVGIESVDDLLVSDRDGQPIVLLFGEAVGRQRTPPIIAHEKEGIDGDRLVVLLMGKAKLMSEEELNAQLAGR